MKKHSKRCSEPFLRYYTIQLNSIVLNLAPISCFSKGLTYHASPMEKTCTNGLTAQDIAALRGVCSAAIMDDNGLPAYLGAVEVLADARYDKAQRPIPFEHF